MRYRRRIYFTAEQRSEILDRWQRAESMSSIGRGFDRDSSSIYPLLSRTGGIRPPARARSRLALTLVEREEISRGLESHLSLLLLGIVMHVVDPENTHAALALMSVSVVFIGYVLYWQSTPNKPIFELSPEGMLYRIPATKEVFVPCHGVESIDISGTNWLGLKFRKVTVALVSKSFYDANTFIDSVFKRGQYWRYQFIPKSDMVQIAVHHEPLAIPAAEVREAVESRWRAFSRHPNAKLPAATNAGDRVSGQPVVRGPSRALIRGALAVLAVLAGPAIYLWQ